MTRNPRRNDRCHGDLVALVVGVAARTTLATGVLLALWAAVPVLLGWTATTVVSESMSPAVRAGDVVAAMPVDADAVTVGQVLLVEDPDHEGRQRLHRLERIEADGALRLRGDANPAPDRTAVGPDRVIGVGVLRFPFVGLPNVWLRTGDWSALATTAAVVVLLVLLGRADRDLRTGVPCRRCGTPRWDLRTEVDDARTTLSVGAVALPTVAALTLAAMAVSTAGAGFSGTTDGRSTLASTPSFPCFHHDPVDAVLAWDFAERNGPGVLDTSGSGQDGQFVGSGGVRADGSCTDNPFASFGAAGDAEGWVVTDTAVAAPDVFTVSVWFRSTGSDGGRIVGFGSDRGSASTHRDRHLYVGADGHLRFGVEGSGSQFKFTVSSSSSVVDGEWHHAVATFQPRSMELWLDGVRQGGRTDAVTLRQYDGYWRAARQTLSGWPGVGSYAFTGDIDTVRVHHRVLDGAMIRAEFAAGR
ncbi:LamG-like jellyroll fold domain-containing protein [Curtobacterium sp. 9128]|uniref:LamG-like jellyroll fold domain-containing protein n=1 Tax=Curtobacterium sp. 9128 TaxID=1793722 RepID=UPI0011A06FE0|nr:LamG-like jellyroll fold domain-containing protein [Curtobacterium sp. 9128]